MTHRQRFFSVLAGRPVDRPAFFPDITNWYLARRTPPGQPSGFSPGQFIPDDDPICRRRGDMPDAYADWTLLDFYRNFDWGLPVHVYNWYETTCDGADRTVTVEGSRRITRWHCPAGEVRKVDALAADGSWAPTEHFVKDLADLEVIRQVVAGSRIVPRYDRVRAVLEALGERGVADLPIMRCPFGKLVQEYMGFERVIYALHDEPAAILEFMEFQEAHDLEAVRLAAEAPARIVIISDHADENLICPPHYRQYCVPFYRKAADILHAAGKIVSTHLDGNFKGHFPILGETGFDLLDGCTPAPMMNYQVEQLAEALPAGMSCYCGVPATLFTQHLPDERITAFGRRILDAFGGQVILNVGDILPANADISQVVRLGEAARQWKRGA